MDVSTGYPQVQHQAVLEVLSSVLAFFLWNSFVSFMWKPRRKKISHNFCATVKIVFLNVYNKTAIPSAGIECLSVCDVGFVLKESV